MKPEALTTWLDSIVCTRPFTLADARELQALIRGSIPATSVEVVGIGADVVHVRVATQYSVIERDLSVV